MRRYSISGSCVAPLRLAGRRGKQSTPRVWLGGTGERSRLASRSDAEQERCGARTTFEDEQKGNGMNSQAGRIKCTR